MKIPHDRLQPATLDRLMEEFISRDGTEDTEMSVKLRQVRRQLETGHAVIVFDPKSQTCNIILSKDYREPEPEDYIDESPHESTG